MGTKVIWDGTPQDMDKLKAENPGLQLVEVHDHVDGKALVFVPPPPLSPEERITALELKVAALEKKP